MGALSLLWGHRNITGADEVQLIQLKPVHADIVKRCVYMVAFIYDGLWLTSVYSYLVSTGCIRDHGCGFMFFTVLHEKKLQYVFVVKLVRRRLQLLRGLLLLALIQYSSHSRILWTMSSMRTQCQHQLLFQQLMSFRL